MRVCIIFPHVGYCTGYRPHLATEVINGASYHIAQALTYLYSIARVYTDDVIVVDFNFHDYETNIDRIVRFAPDVVLLSSTMNSYDSTRQIVKTIDQRLPESKICIGGPAISSNYRMRPELVTVDAECEFIPTYKDIFAWVKNVFGIDHTLDFSTFLPDNRWIKDTYPASALPDIRFSTITSLGCTFKCNFCLNPKVYKIEYKEIGVLEREIANLFDDYGPQRISVADPYFFMDFSHAREIMSMFESGNIEWSQQTCLVTLTKENIKLMSRANCKSVLVGVENFASDEIDKPVSAADLEYKIEMLIDHGIRIKPSFISGLNDIPYEDDLKQIAYIRSLIDRGLVESNQIQSNIYTPYVPDPRDRLLDVPYRFWGVLPVAVLDEADFGRKLNLCDLIYQEIFPDTLDRYHEVRTEYLAELKFGENAWLNIDSLGYTEGPRIVPEGGPTVRARRRQGALA